MHEKLEISLRCSKRLPSKKIRSLLVSLVCLVLGNSSIGKIRILNLYFEFVEQERRRILNRVNRFNVRSIFSLFLIRFLSTFWEFFSCFRVYFLSPSLLVSSRVNDERIPRITHLTYIRNLHFDTLEDF